MYNLTKGNENHFKREKLSNGMISLYIEYYKGSNTDMNGKRIIMAVKLKSLSGSIIRSHNHPSGNLNPSKSDIHSLLIVFCNDQKANLHSL